ncbi:archaemetzincin-2-like [Mizuhopecten yessoensis]|uniref:Archaemetzincin-2 n=1 Tax=Mizuhopecten yessoensis TaxID=6573 RepID=A0A210QDT4_MIZYE|nr:archaemetzincin-2-like [Mizuhopecten yessoensis]OWF46828.1 Archaemetzincin-2 [Mizuhopecten yessoensis]
MAARPRSVSDSSKTDQLHWSAIGLETNQDGYIQLKSVTGRAARKRQQEDLVKDAKVFIPDAEFFTPMKKPKKSEWLAEHKTEAQSFKRFLQGAAKYPTPKRNVIYLLPLQFDETVVPADILDPLKQFASIFFGIKLKVMKVRNLKGKVPDRFNNNSNTYQVDAGQVLKEMTTLVPDDAFCVAGITMCDLYPKDSWNFVFGLAQSQSGCGVYSLARYLSNFGNQPTSVYNPEREKGSNSLMKRACKTMCHEIGHMFGLPHCVYFSCIMNGSNHLEESDERSIFLCPVCLRKLHFICQFDIIERYKLMAEFWSGLGYKEESAWLNKRLEFLA